jgi:hypothetical protein
VCYKFKTKQQQKAHHFGSRELCSLCPLVAALGHDRISQYVACEKAKGVAEEVVVLKQSTPSAVHNGTGLESEMQGDKRTSKKRKGLLNSSGSESTLKSSCPSTKRTEAVTVRRVSHKHPAPQ